MRADGPEQRDFERDEQKQRDLDYVEALYDRADSLKGALLDIAPSHLDAMRVCEHRARSNAFGLDRLPHCVFCGQVMP